MYIARNNQIIGNYHVVFRSRTSKTEDTINKITAIILANACDVFTGLSICTMNVYLSNSLEKILIKCNVLDEFIVTVSLDNANYFCSSGTQHIYV
jgi:hypothetical protein